MLYQTKPRAILYRINTGSDTNVPNITLEDSTKNTHSVTEIRGFTYTIKLIHPTHNNLPGAKYISVQAIHPRVPKCSDGLRKGGLWTIITISGKNIQ
jgi:hypothetical protein